MKLILSNITALKMCRKYLSGDSCDKSYSGSTFNIRDVVNFHFGCCNLFLWSVCAFITDFELLSKQLALLKMYFSYGLQNKQGNYQENTLLKLPSAVLQFNNLKPAAGVSRGFRLQPWYTFLSNSVTRI